MSRVTDLLGVAAVSVLLSVAASAEAPQQNAVGATMMQNLDASIRDAQAKRAQHDYAGAVSILSQLMLVLPDDARVVGEYGKVLVQQGRAREAIDFLTRAVQLQPGDWTLYSALGIAYDQNNDFASARTAYDRALALKPGEAVVLNNYAMSRMLAGDPAQARRLIGQAAVASGDETIARNVKLVESLPAPAVATASPPRPAPVAASAPAPANVAQHPPRTLTTPSVATAAPRVMMQAVPADPQAGGVAKPKAKGVAAAKHTAHPPAAKTAKAAAPPANNGIPALRLANDRP